MTSSFVLERDNCITELRTEHNNINVKLSLYYLCIVAKYRFLWGIGTSPNDTDVMEWREYEHYEKWACVDIALNHSDTYYNTIAAYNKALNSRRTEKTSDGSK